ncbi:MAG: hypothetical protein IBX44_03295 [Sulfurospirillum sp.]|nr:hypothetical protein [Sulfurospirillum sp.]
MQIENKTICNICLKPSDAEANTVYIKAICNDEEIHVCTGCIPHIIHGSGDIVKSNETVKAQI